MLSKVQAELNGQFIANFVKQRISAIEVAKYANNFGEIKINKKRKI